MRLFFSWQSDIPENKKLLRKLLQSVCKEHGVEYTDDTRDEAGGGHVVDALLRKIENSHIFVGDITIVGKADNGDSVINSNVAYELGYAEAKLTRNALLLMMNEEFGSYEEMPFDLGKRIITKYRTKNSELTPAEIKTLRGDLTRKIKSFINGGSITTTVSVQLNKTEKTLLYWSNHLGDGHISEAYLSPPDSKYNSHNYVVVGKSSYFSKSNVTPLHIYSDTKSKARLRNGRETLATKGLLIKAASESWVLSEEGELAAATISEDEVYPLPESL